jgi:hypothetical protein
MSYQAHKDRYLDLIHSFLNSELDGPTFEAAFMRLWKQDRDEQWARKQSWPEPYDEQLQNALKGGAITADEFSQRWRELWGYPSREEQGLIDMLDRVFTASDAFVADPQLRSQPEVEYDEDQFRSEVGRIFESYIGRPVGSS